MPVPTQQVAISRHPSHRVLFMRASAWQRYNSALITWAPTSETSTVNLRSYCQTMRRSLEYWTSRVLSLSPQIGTSHQPHDPNSSYSLLLTPKALVPSTESRHHPNTQPIFSSTSVLSPLSYFCLSASFPYIFPSSSLGIFSINKYFQSEGFM